MAVHARAAGGGLGAGGRGRQVPNRGEETPFRLDRRRPAFSSAGGSVLKGRRQSDLDFNGEGALPRWSGDEVVDEGPVRCSEVEVVLPRASGRSISPLPESVGRGFQPLSLERDRLCTEAEVASEERADDGGLERLRVDLVGRSVLIGGLQGALA